QAAELSTRAPHLDVFLIASCSHPTPPPAISTLSLHDALPISPAPATGSSSGSASSSTKSPIAVTSASSSSARSSSVSSSNSESSDRKSTRLNSSHEWISYAVFCLKKKRSAFVGGPE